MIFVFGSIGVDFVTRVEVIPAPGFTVVGPACDLVAGGKGANQALAAARAGGKVALIGAVGEDARQNHALDLLKEAGVSLDHVHVLAGQRTQSAFISIDAKGQNAITVALGCSLLARADWVPLAHMGAQDLVLVQRELPDTEIASVLRQAKMKGAKTLLNAAPAAGFAAELLDHLDLLIVNEHEVIDVAKVLGLSGKVLGDPRFACEAIAKARSLSVIVTLGAEGAFMCDGELRLNVPPFNVHVVDSTAAGDAFCGALAAALAEGHDFRTAMIWGNAAGALACTQAGAQPSLPQASAIKRLIG